jgi:capsular polysaccharide biosynthesis protein
VQAERIVGTVAVVSTELLSDRSAGSPGSRLTATVYEKVMVPDSPVSPCPLRNGLLTLVAGLALIGVVAMVSCLRRS